MRKSRPACGLPAELKKLTVEQLAAFHRLLNEEIPYRVMIPRVLAEFGIRTSKGALSDYYVRQIRAAELHQPGEQVEMRVGGFELVITYAPPGTVHIVARELPPPSTGEVASK